jgi:hypothetical protein
MNSELWAPGKPSFTKPYCGKQGSATMDPKIHSYSWDSNGEKNTQKTKISSNNSWRPGMETSGVMGDQIFLELRKVTVMNQLHNGIQRGKTKNGLDNPPPKKVI